MSADQASSLPLLRATSFVAPAVLRSEASARVVLDGGGKVCAEIVTRSFVRKPRGRSADHPQIDLGETGLPYAGRYGRDATPPPVDALLN